MTRQAVRDMKRAIRAGNSRGADEDSATLGRACALSLLSRSIGFGHGRLAVIRLGMAVQAGAYVPTEHWQYCRRAADASKDSALQRLFLAAALRDRTRNS